MEQQSTQLLGKDLDNLLNKIIEPVFEDGVTKLFEYREDYKSTFKQFLEAKYRKNIADNELEKYLEPIVQYFYKAADYEANILSILPENFAVNKDQFDKLLTNLQEINDFRSKIFSRSNSQSNLHQESSNHIKTRSGTDFYNNGIKLNNDSNDNRTLCDALNYHYSFQGFMETVRQFYMFVNAYSKFLKDKQPENKEEKIKIYKYQNSSQNSSLEETQETLDGEEKNHLLKYGCYCKDKDNIYFTALYKKESDKPEEIKRFFKEEGCKVFKIYNKNIIETNTLSKAEIEQLKKDGYYNHGSNRILFTKKRYFKTLNTVFDNKLNDESIKKFFGEENEAINIASDSASQYFNKKQNLLKSETDKINKQKLVALTSSFIGLFAKRTIENYDFLNGEKIRKILDNQIKAVVIPFGEDKIKEILSFLDGAGVKKLKDIQVGFSNKIREVKLLISENFKKLSDLYKKNSLEISLQEPEKEFNKEIGTYFDKLQEELSSAIAEKTTFINLVKKEYEGALQGVLPKTSNNSTSNVKNKVVSNESNNSKNLFSQYNELTDDNKDKKIYNKLPKWIQEGVDGFTTRITIGNKEVGFALNTSQKTIIKKLKEFSNPHNQRRSQTQSFYLGTGGGKTYLNDLVSGKEGLEITGSDGKKYEALQIKKAIFGDLEPNIISINFHQIKNEQDFTKQLDRFNGPNKANILILDEYHLFPKDVRNKINILLKGKNIFVIKSTATPTPEELYYKNLKREILGDNGTKKLSENTHKEIMGKIDLFLLSNQQNNSDISNKKYHLIIDDSMMENSILNKPIKDCGVKNIFNNQQPDIKIFGFKNKENKEQFFIAEKQGDNSYKKIAVGNGGIFPQNNFDKSELNKYLLKKENKSKEYQIYYPSSISAGGDFGIKDGSGDTKISIVINDSLLSKPSTEIVNYCLQAIGRDRFFDWSDKESFNKVRFVNQEGDDIANVIKEKFKEAQHFYKNTKNGSNIENLNVKSLSEYLSNKFENPADKQYIAFFYQIIKNSQQKSNQEIVNTIEKAFGDKFKKYHSHFATAKIIHDYKNHETKFFKEIKSIKISASQPVNQSNIIESFKDNLLTANILSSFGSEVKFTSELIFTAGNDGLTYDYIISADLKEGLGTTSTDEQSNNLNNFLSLTEQNNPSDRCFTTQYEGKNKINFSYFKSLEYCNNKKIDDDIGEGIDEEKPNTLIKVNQVKLQFHKTPGINIILNNPTKDYHKDSQISNKTLIDLEARAILHLFNNVLEGKDGKFTEENKKLIKKFFVKNKLKQNISSPAKNSDLESDNGSTTSSNKSNHNAIDLNLEIIKRALSQRNEYKDGNKINDREDSNGREKGWRAGEAYKNLKNTLQTLNEDNINFTTESLRLFNVDNKNVLKSDQEKTELVKDKPLFVRAMGSANMLDFVNISQVDVPQNNIVVKKFTSKKELQTNLTSMEIVRNNNQQQ